MTPEELDDMIDYMIPVCLFCATTVDPDFDKTLCRNCWKHVMEHPNERLRLTEVTSATFAIVLGLTRGMKNLASQEFGSERERFTKIQTMLHKVQSHDPPQRHTLYCRFAALYLPALADVLVTTNRSRRFRPFRSFLYMLVAVFQQPYFAKFCLSDDPRAANGNRLANAIAGQLLVHLPKWELESAENVHGWDSDPIYLTFLVLTAILMLQVDKPEAVPLEDDVRRQLTGTVERWLHRAEKRSETRNEIRILLKFLERDERVIEPSRRKRDELEELQECSREECNQREGLWLCSRCGTVTYCGRKHQREHWNAEPDGHKRVCYRSWF